MQKGSTSIVKYPSALPITVSAITRSPTKHTSEASLIPGNCLFISSSTSGFFFSCLITGTPIFYSSSLASLCPVSTLLPTELLNNATFSLPYTPTHSVNASFISPCRSLSYGIVSVLSLSKMMYLIPPFAFNLLKSTYAMFFALIYGTNKALFKNMAFAHTFIPLVFIY